MMKQIFFCITGISVFVMMTVYVVLLMNSKSPNSYYVSIASLPRSPNSLQTSADLVNVSTTITPLPRSSNNQHTSTDLANISVSATSLPHLPNNRQTSENLGNISTTVDDPVTVKATTPASDSVSVPLSIAPPSTSEISRIIHQSWKVQKLPPRFKKWSQTWHKDCFPDWEYKLWTDKDNRQLIVEHYPWFLARYDGLPKSIYRADVIRYFYMYHYGGIYADLDDYCVKPFEHLLANYSLVFGAMEGQFGGVVIPEGYTQNSFMYSRARHPFWMRLIRQIEKSGNKGPPERITGPIILAKEIVAYRRDVATDVVNKTAVSRSGSTDLKVYEPIYFNPFSWLTNKVRACKDLNSMSDEDIKACVEAYSKRGSYVIQFHTQTWGRGKTLRRLL